MASSKNPVKSYVYKKNCIFNNVRSCRKIKIKKYAFLVMSYSDKTKLKNADLDQGVEIISDWQHY